jgi:uncharacterized protein
VKQRTNIFLVGLFTLAVFGVAAAEPLEDGLAAYQRGDYAAAIGYWRPLADRGDEYAQDSLGDLYAAGLGVPQDLAQAAAWYRKAAEQGYAPAQAYLGIIYWNGQGVPQDAILGWYMWLRT